MTELLSVDEVAQQLQVQPRTVREYIRTGKLAARKIGKQYRIRVADLQVLTDGPAVVPYEPGTDRATVILDAAPRDAATASRIVALVSASGFADGVDVHLSTDSATGAIKLILTGTLGQVLDRTATVHAILEATHD